MAFLSSAVGIQDVLELNRPIPPTLSLFASLTRNMSCQEQLQTLRTVTVTLNKIQFLKVTLVTGCDKSSWRIEKKNLHLLPVVPSRPGDCKMQP